MVIKSGFAFKSEDFKDDGVPVVKISNIGHGDYILKNQEYLPNTFLQSHREFIVSPGDILIALTRPITDNKLKVCRYPVECKSALLNQRVAIINNNDPERDFLFFYLQSDVFKDEIEKKLSQTLQPNLSPIALCQILQNASFPPLAEQHRIVAKIDGIFREKDRALFSLAKILDLIQTYSASLLHEAMAGRLTAGWRAEHPLDTSEDLSNQIIQSHQINRILSRDNAASPTEGVHDLSKDNIPSSWSIIELRHLCRPGKPITYGILKPGPDVEGGIPYVRVADYPANKIVVDTVRHTSREIADQYRRSQLSATDLLLSIRGTVGRVCEVPKELEGANITQDTARVSVHPLVSRDFIRYYLQSPLVQNRLRKATRGVAIRGVNLGDVRVIQVALPPLAEQLQIVRRLDGMLAYSVEINREATSSYQGAERLGASVLSQAFDGKLIPQDPGDEPASALLERIRTKKPTGKSKQTRIAY